MRGVRVCWCVWYILVLLGRCTQQMMRGFDAVIRVLAVSDGTEGPITER